MHTRFLSPELGFLFWWFHASRNKWQKHNCIETWLQRRWQARRVRRGQENFCVSVPSDLAWNCAVCWAEMKMFPGFDWQTEGAQFAFWTLTLHYSWSRPDRYINSFCTPTHAHVSSCWAGEQILSPLVHMTRNVRKVVGFAVLESSHGCLILLKILVVVW